MFLNYYRVTRSRRLTVTRARVTVLDMSSVTSMPRGVPRDTLAVRLLVLRHELGWSQREASTQTGVPFGVWQGMESGRETRNLGEHVAKIAERTGYRRDWLMWGGPLGTTEGPHPDEPDEGQEPAVRHQGLEPRTRWLRALRPFVVKGVAA